MYISIQLKYTGLSIKEKLGSVRQELSEENAFMIIITALDEIACEYKALKTFLSIYITISISMSRNKH